MSSCVYPLYLWWRLHCELWVKCQCVCPHLRCDWLKTMHAELCIIQDQQWACQRSGVFVLFQREQKSTPCRNLYAQLAVTGLGHWSVCAVLLTMQPTQRWSRRVPYAKRFLSLPYTQGWPNNFAAWGVAANDAHPPLPLKGIVLMDWQIGSLHIQQ